MDKWLSIFDDCTGVSTDSRQIHQDCLYVALKGENFDGNAFAKQAIAAGAKYAIVDDPEFADEKNIFLVANGLEFLQALAHAHRLRFDIPVIGITGSNGKTSTKELVNCALQTQFCVLCTEGNLNNHIGVPLTLLKLNAQHEIAIIEMGANKLLDIDELCRIAKPTMGLITNIGKAHLEGFKDFDGVLKTKSELYDHVGKVGGDLFVNADDHILMAAAQNRKLTIHSFGSTNGQLKGVLKKLDPFVQLSWTYQGYDSPILDTQMIGKYNFYNFLAALRIGMYFQIEPDKLNAAISNYLPTNKRSQIEKTNRNTLIVDCYNANPSSMMSALSSFIEIAHPKKLVILGDMLELGADGPGEHQKILEFVNEKELAYFTIGKIFKTLNDHGFNSVSDLVEQVNLGDIKDTLVLLKGSRGIALEQLIGAL